MRKRMRVKKRIEQQIERLQDRCGDLTVRSKKLLPVLERLLRLYIRLNTFLWPQCKANLIDLSIEKAHRDISNNIILSVGRLEREWKEAGL